MKYDKIKYWNNRKDPNNDLARLNAKKYISWVNKNFNDDDFKILEYGPGIGRMVECYINKKINFYDISNNYKDRLVNKCKNLHIPINSYTIDTSGNIKTKFKDNEFDLVCAFEVLLHSPENEIEDLMLELSRIGKRVIIITWYKNGKILDKDYCFTRDYKEIINKNNLSIEVWDDTSFKNQVGFVYKKK